MKRKLNLKCVKGQLVKRRTIFSSQLTPDFINFTFWRTYYRETAKERYVEMYRSWRLHVDLLPIKMKHFLCFDVPYVPRSLNDPFLSLSLISMRVLWPVVLERRSLNVFFITCVFAMRVSASVFVSRPSAGNIANLKLITSQWDLFWSEKWQEMNYVLSALDRKELNVLLDTRLLACVFHSMLAETRLPSISLRFVHILQNFGKAQAWFGRKICLSSFLVLTAQP